ncbi:alpha/beta hydrolase [Streptomyces sp. ISL-100]|uniref:alpha/beta hydrolase n=1 Tax=Streptomyces sp. ISL-100 TaxID=2819173 RepID=UPI001BE82463|nr:alpha/beta hydrolase [Streptomyces sp. ISL-100]MBT2401960.1 alpha/beta fold hydrolase [Streptomyces sp. ISL-100]
MVVFKLRVTGVLGLALFLSAVPGCGGSSDEAGSGTTPSSAGMAKISAFSGQRLDWKPCAKGQKALCSTVKVPLDYADPGPGNLSIAMYKFPATGKKKGSLLVNPGGPGGPGLEFAAMMARSPLSSSYDIVGFDPRGVGASGQIHCLDDAAHDAYYAAPTAPTTAEGRNQRRQAAKRLAQACGEKHLKLLPHVGTENTARDLEVMRSVLGDRKLNFLGVSYGTLIGQYYAEQYPSRVGRMYLDSVMDPALPLPKIIEDNAASSQQTLERFLDNCVTQKSCQLGGSREQAEQKVLQMVKALDATPVPVASDPRRPVTGSDLREAVLEGVGSAGEWPQLTQALVAAVKRDFSGIRDLADYSHGRGEDGKFSGEDETFLAVACNFASKDDRSHRALDQAIAEATRKSPLFGPLDMFRPCSDWPVASSVTAHEVTADTPEPILLANNSVDPETPLSWAKAAAEGLEDSTLVTNEGAGHGFLDMGPCTGKVMTDYLINGTVPKAGTVCKDTGLGKTGETVGK